MAEESSATEAEPTNEEGKYDLLELLAQHRDERSGRAAREVAECLAIGDTPSTQVLEDRRAATAAALADVEPGDEFQSLLIAQLLTVHGMAMDCVRSARDPAREEPLRLAYLGHAGRLLSLFSRHIGRLERHHDWCEAKVQETLLHLQRVEAARDASKELKMYNDIIRTLAKNEDGGAARPKRLGGERAIDPEADEFAS